MGFYGGPRGGAVSYEQGTPVPRPQSIFATNPMYFQEQVSVHTLQRKENPNPFNEEIGLTETEPARSLLAPQHVVDPSFRALSGRLKFTVRRHRCNKNSFPWNRS